MNQMNLQQLQAMMAQSSQNARKPAVEFRAGMLTLSGTTVTADKRRGKVALSTEDDGLLHLKWSLRPSGAVERDLSLFPQSATWEKVPECTDGRVFLLKFKSSTTQYFFWMQEPKDDKDEEITKKINELIANPQSGSAGAGSGAGGLMGTGMDQQQLMNLLGAGAPAPSGGSSGSSTTSSTPSTSSSTSTSTPVPAAGNQQVASLIAQQLQAQQANQLSYGIPDILDSERVVPHLDQDDELVQSLLEHLPESQRNPAQLRATLRSPQFQQTAARLGSVLNSEQYAAVMASLSLPLAPSGDMGVPAFLTAIQLQADEKKDEEEEKEKEKEAEKEK